VLGFFNSFLFVFLVILVYRCLDVLFLHLFFWSSGGKNGHGTRSQTAISPEGCIFISYLRFMLPLQYPFSHWLHLSISLMLNLNPWCSTLCIPVLLFWGKDLYLFYSMYPFLWELLHQSAPLGQLPTSVYLCYYRGRYISGRTCSCAGYH